MVSNFKIDWESLNITKKKILVKLGIRVGNKRELVYDNDLWVDTAPLEVTDFAGQETRIRRYEVKCLRELNEKYMEDLDLKERLISDLEDKVARLTSERDKSKHESINKHYQEKAMRGKSQSHSAQIADVPKIPTYTHPPKGKKKKKKPG